MAEPMEFIHIQYMAIHIDASTSRARAFIYIIKTSLSRRLRPEALAVKG